MPTKKMTVEFSREEILDLIVEKYKLDKSKTTLRVDHYAGDQREPAYTKVIVTTERDFS